MQFSDSANLTGIVEEIDRICNSNSVKYTVKDKTPRVNAALDRFFHLAMLYSGEWQVDDTGNTTLPIATTNLVSGQYDYSFAAELLTLIKVLAADAAGNMVELLPVDQNEFGARNIFTQPTGNSGIPTRYDVFGNSLLVDPVPNYNANGGLKVVFQRNGIKFVYTDTTATPGIPSLFHMYLARYAALPFLIEKRLPQVKAISDAIAIDEEAIMNFYSNRSKFRRTTISPKFRSSR